MQQNAPPAAYGTAQAPSTDSSVYMGGDYLKLLNLNFFQQQVNRQNQQLYAGYQGKVQGWAAGGMQGNPPQVPLYQSVDLNGFNQWWDTFNQNLAAGAPPQTFIKNAVPDNGYGGASMFSGFSV